MMKKPQFSPWEPIQNLATSEEMIIQFRIVDGDLTPLIGLDDSETLKLIEFLRENISVIAPANPSVPVFASEGTTPLTDSPWRLF